MTDKTLRGSNHEQWDSSALVRQWRLIKLLTARRLGLTINQIRAELGISDKTARRDLIALRDAGFPVQENKGDFGRKTWRINSKQDAPDINFNFEEAAALYLGQRLLQPLSSTAIGNAALSANRKVRAALSDAAVRYLDRMAGNLETILPSSQQVKGKILDSILIGIEDAKVVFITYQSQRATEPVTYDIHPYAIALYKSAVYVIGFAPQHQAIRHWKLSRIERAEVDRMPFRRPEDFDLRKHLDGSFGIFQATGSVAVRVRFSQPVARYVQETQWHASQKNVAAQLDGSVIVEFQLSSTIEIRQWLFSFGRHAEVLSPDSLRQEMSDEAAAILQRYAAPPTELRARAARQVRTARTRSPKG